MAYIGIGPASFTNNLTNVQILDDIKAGFNGSTTTFNLTSNSIPFQAVSDRALMVILGGVIQAPGVDYTINLAQITFTTAPVSGLTFYARNIYGLNALNVVNDGIVGPYSLTTGGPTWDTSGNITISGNLTVQGATTTISSTTLDVIDKDIKLASNQSTNAGIDTAGLLFGTTAVKLKYYNNGGTNPGLNIEGTNLGIGVTAPTAKLQVDGSSAGQNTLLLTGSYSGGNPNVDIQTWQRIGGAVAAKMIYKDATTDLHFGSSTSHRFSLMTGGTARLVLNSDGHVDVVGNLDVGSGVDVTGAVTADDLIVTGPSVVADLKSTNNNYVLGIAGNNATVKSYLGTDSSGNFLLATGSGVSGRLGIDAADGHITPGAAGTQDLGSTSKEFRHLYLGDSGKVQLGLDQDFTLWHNNSHGLIKNTTGRLYVLSDDVWFKNEADNKTSARFFEGNEVFLYHNNTVRLTTTSTGITVSGEVAATQDYPNYRPEFDFNFAAVKKLDPRMTFTRTGEASYHDSVGSVKFVGDNVPRFDHDIVTGECKGLLVEPTGTNFSYYSRRFDSIASGSWVPQNGGATPTVTANTHTAPDGTPTSSIYSADTITGATGTAFNGNVMQQQYAATSNVKHTFSLYVKLLTATQATIYIRDGATGSISSTSAVNTKDWQRLVVTSSANLTNSTTHSFYFGNTNGTIAVWGSQIENKSYGSSYMKTEAGATGSRVADFPRLEGEDFTDMISQEAGTLIAEFDNQSNDGYVLSIDSGAPKIGMVNNDGYQLAGKQDSGASLGTTDNGTVLDGINKFALAYAKDNAAISINGNTASVDSGFNPLPTTIYLWFGLREGQYDHLGGAISRVVYYKQRLSNSQLKNLTS